MAEKKRVLILSANAGFGHRSASNAIAGAFEESYSDTCDFEVVNPLDYPKTPTWLREVQSDYDRIARDMPAIFKFGFDISDNTAARRVAENGIRVILYRTMKDIVTAHRPDVIINTYPFYSAALNAVFASLRESVPIINVVTDLVVIHQSWYSRYADLTVVPTPAVRDLAIASGLDPEKVEVVGIPVHPRIRAEKREKRVLREALGWDPDLTAVLVVGSKRMSSLPSTLNVLNHSGLPIQLVAVTGGDDKTFEELSKVEWHCPTKLYNFVTDMPALMRAADCMVSKAGGLIVSESLAAGLPILVIEAIPGQETGNLEHVLKGGAGGFADEPLKVLETMRHWLLDDGRILKEKAANARALGRPDAASDVAARAWTFAQHGRRKLHGSLARRKQAMRDQRIARPGNDLPR